MGDDSFQRAVQKARRGYSLTDWTTITPRERTEAIYREMRRIDADRVRRGQHKHPAHREELQGQA